jgi:predicted ATPase/DNA-binding SARP family transcriptional activator
VAPILHIHLLGDFLICADKTPLTALNVPRVQALLAFLVLKRNAPQPRRHLAFLLWPDSAEAQARANLRKLLHQLLHALPDADRYLHADIQTIQWRSEAPFRLDVADFEHALTRAQAARRAGEPAAERAALEQAVRVYRGELLPGCYEEWLLPERERLHQTFLGGLEQLIGLCEQQHDYPAAITYAQHLLRHDPLHEATYRQLMRLHARNGDRASALESYRTCAAILEHELGIEPSRATREAFEQIQRPEEASQRTYNLPSQPTSFIGRAAELAKLAQLLEHPTCRLITVVGPGGIGKTRLALQAAATYHDRFVDGVWIISLAPIGDSSLVASTIAQMLGVRETSGQPLLRSLIDYLHEKEALLLLDNFEQVTEAAALIGSLLAAAPHLRIMITSRVVLHLYGEHEIVVPPLGLPPQAAARESSTGNAPLGEKTEERQRYSALDRQADHEVLDELTRYEATRLFIERAEAVNADFRITHDNAAAVVAICQHLEGLPLAIELAAVRCKVFTAPALLVRLDNRLKFLIGGARDLPERHPALRSTIDWSYRLLDAPEQRLFRRLGVFMGGCTLEAAEAVASELRIENEELRNASHDQILLNSQFSILNSVETLVNNSLLQQLAGPDGEPRFVMLDTIREYAVERLEASGESDALHRRHAAFYLELAEAAERKVQDATQDIWIERLERDHDNLRAALDWTLAGGDLEVGTRLASALWPFWWMRGYGSEGRMWLEEALRQSDHVAPATRAKIFLVGGSVSVQKDDLRSATLGAQALVLFRELDDTAGMAKALAHLADMAWQQGDYAQATALATESLALSRKLGNQSDSAFALHKLGDIARDQGDYERASALLEESLATWQALSHDEACAFVLNGLGDVALNQGDYLLAAARYEEALALFHEMGGHDATAWILRNLGRVAHIQGDDDRAVALLEESVTWFRKVRDRLGLAWALHHLGIATHAQGNYTRATALLHEALVLQQQHDHKSQIAETLEGFAQIASGHGQAARAARLLGAADGLRTAIGAPRPPGEHAPYERIVAGVRAQLDQETFVAAWTAGRAMTLEQAAAFALAS